MTDPRIPTGPPEQQPADPIPPEHDQDHQARQLAHTLTTAPGCRASGEDTDDDHC
jgi:hypothetical protein